MLKWWREGRTTDGATIAGLDAGSWFSSEFARERVPTLEEVLSLDRVELELELKLKGYGADVLAGVIDAVRTAHASDRVEFTGWNLPLLAVLKRGTPSARIGLLSSRRPSWMPGSVFEHLVGTAARPSGTPPERSLPRRADMLRELRASFVNNLSQLVDGPSRS